MLWNIDFDGQGFEDCFDCLITSLATYYGYDAAALKLGCFSPFIIGGDGWKTGELADMAIRDTSIYQTARQLFGMRLSTVAVESSSIHEVILRNIKYAPLCIDVDPFDCAWTDFYLKNHWMHNLLIVDVDVKLRAYRCLDIYFPAKGYIKLSFEEMERICNDISKIHFNKRTPPCILDFRILLRCHQELPISHLKMCEKDRIESWVSHLTKNVEATNRELQTSIFLIKLSWIARDKKLFAQGLEYLETRLLCKPVFDAVYEPLRAAEKKIGLLKNVLIKAFLSRRISSDLVMKLMEDIVDCNFDAFWRLQSAIGSIRI